MNSVHLCRMDSRIKERNIVPYPIENGMNFFPPWRLTIIVRWLGPRSRGLQPLMQHRLIMTATTPHVWYIRIRQILESYRPTKRRARIPPSTMDLRTTAYFARMQECIIESATFIDPRIALLKVLTKHLSSIDWEDPYVTGMMWSSITRKLKISWKVIRKNLTRKKYAIYHG